MLRTIRKLLSCLFIQCILAGCASGFIPDPDLSEKNQAAIPAEGNSGSETYDSNQEAGSPSGRQPEMATPTQVIGKLWIDPAVPAQLRDSLALPGNILPVESKVEATIRLEPGEGESAAQWVYAAAVPFPTLTDEIFIEDIRNAWHGKAAGEFGGIPLLMSQSTRMAFSELWGEPGEGAVRILDDRKLLETAWEDMPCWAIIPFEEISPRWKVLRIDNQSPLDKQFDIETYPLVIRFSFSGSSELISNISSHITNRDPEKLTVLVMTGVTALVRATGVKMEKNGMDYPARDIGDWLKSADLTHISNEVSFVSECPPAKPSQKSLMFCSRPEYLDLLKDIDADIIELTGNHLMDWRRSALPESLAMYHEAGMKYYGSGEDLESARQPLLLEHNGNRFAFLGCNPAGPEMVWATDEIPGAAPCDYEWMKTEIGRLRAEGILPIATLQYFESYSFIPTPGEQADFPPLAEAGAVIVSGSQAHYPQGMTFVGDSFVHFGLGNLFFDQMYMPTPGTEADAVLSGTRKEFIDRHVFYDGRYIGTELLTALLEDYAKPRPMTAEERVEMLTSAFEESIW